MAFGFIYQMLISYNCSVISEKIHESEIFRSYLHRSGGKSFATGVTVSNLHMFANLPGVFIMSARLNDNSDVHLKYSCWVIILDS